MNLKQSLPKFSYEGLLICLVTLYGLIPLTHQIGGSQIFVKMGFTLVLLASVYMVSNKRYQALIAIILATPALLGHWVSAIGDFYKPHLMEVTFPIALEVYVTFILVNNVFRAQIIDRSILYGSVCIYLMIGLIFGSCYVLVEVLEPQSFLGLENLKNIPTGEGATPTVWHHLFYYSFITLTTLGYGHIAPGTVMASALSSAEAIIGQFYLTILVARLVSTYVSTSQRDEQAETIAKVMRKLRRSEENLLEGVTPSPPKEDS